MITGLFVDWLIFGSIAMLGGALLTLLALRYFRRELRPRWLAAFLGLGLAWLFIVLARLGIPKEIGLGDWHLPGVILLSTYNSPTFLLDNISWTLALTIVSLGLSAILTAVSRLAEANWRSWSGTLSLTTLGVLAALAGNILTIILAWTALDIVEFIIWVTQVRIDIGKNQLFASFAVRLTGLLLMIGFTMASVSSGISLAFDSLSTQLSPFILLVAGIRLGIIPIHFSFPTERALQQGVGTMLRMSPLIAILVVLIRVAGIGIPPDWVPPLLFLALFVFIFATIRWAVSEDELVGRPYWVLSVAAWAYLSAILGQPIDCLIWGVAALLSGGLLYLGSVKTRNLLVFHILASLSLTMLPFSPTWQLTSIFTAMVEKLPTFQALIVVPLGLIGYSVFVMGYILHGVRTGVNSAVQERWIWFLYLPGLALLLFVNFAMGWLNLMEVRSISLLDWLTGLMICGIIISMLAVGSRHPERYQKENLTRIFHLEFFSSIFSFRWFFTFISGLYRVIRVPFNTLNTILEGEGGLLWSYLLLVMLLSLAFQIRWFR